MASLFKVKALYDFEAKEEDDLGFPAGQIIDVTEEVDDNWMEGKYSDVTGLSKAGIFPREFVEKYEPEVPQRPTRPSRPKQETTAPAPAPVPAAQPPRPEPEDEEEGEEEDAPPVPAMSKPQPPPVAIPQASAKEEMRSPPSATSQKSPPVREEPPPAPKPTPAEPAAPASGKKPPPPIAAKSNAFRDRIAAFNQPAAAPIAPIVPGGPKPGGSAFIKKPFVAPPPMSNSYVPPPKQEPVHKPYIREEDPEIRRRLEEDRAAAESAGLTAEGGQEEEDEDAPKPTSLKERIARLQQQQMEQAQRRAEGGTKEKKKPPVKKPSESSEHGIEAGEGEEMQRERSADTQRQSLDVSREKPRVPSASRRPPEPTSPLPTAPEHELVSDGNEADHSAAGETTEDDAGTIGPDDSDETQAPAPPRRTSTAPKQQPDVGDEEDTTEDAEEEDSMDEETRKRMEIRERMAKMSGGMGMAGMFGPPGGMPMPGGGAPKKKSTKDRKASEDSGAAAPPPSSPPQPAQPIPMIPVPGMSRVRSPESDRTQMAEERARDEDDYDEEVQPVPPSRKSTQSERGAPPPVPKDSRPPQGAPSIPGSSQATPRPVPPPPEARPVPPPPPAGPLSPGPGSESDDEASMHQPNKSSAETSGVDTPGPLPIRVASGAAPPVPTSATDNKRSSYFGSEPTSATSDKRASRPPPPVPGSPLTSPRPPPPPPPTAIPSRSATTHEADDERGESEYEGDYDTDIASSAKHKDALKSHVREVSLDDSTTADETPMNSAPAPPPHATAPRAVPPPPPSQATPKTRPSMDAPRAPPPIPPIASPRVEQDDDEYDPYRYDSSLQRGPPPPVPGGVPIAAPPMPPREPPQESSADDMYSTTPPRRSLEAPQRPMPAPPTEAPPARAAPRQSLDVHRSNTTARRSMDQPRPSGEFNGQIAQDINLSQDTPWWTSPRPLPPALQSRNGVDILSESEESTTSKRGGRTTISKDIYVLYIDYSQTIITAQYDSSNPAEVSLDQRHLPPPPKLRQDQLETYWQRFGQKISEQVNALGHSKKDQTVGDGSPTSLVVELIKAQPAALQPVGTRAFGSLVYANLANASTMQFDEIRPGDVVTLRNARFEGSHGAMKHKYKVEYGISHVAIVEEWDGTRRAIRGWEQGREKKDKGVRSEKFRLGDLRSGEVKVWRVVGRDWVEWETGH